MIQRTWWPRLNRNAQLAKGLVFAGLGGGASTLQYADASSYGNHGVLTGMDPATDWVFDPTLGRFRLDFDGSNDVVDLPSATVGAWSALSVAVWVFPTADITEFIVGRVHKTLAKYDWGLYRSSASDAFYWYTKTSGVVSSCDSSAHSLNRWYHLCGVYNGSQQQLYVNGVQVDYDNQTGALTVDNDIQVGAHFNTNSSGKEFKGNLSDPLIYNRYLSPAEIQQLADPSNTLLSGLILPPLRMVWPVAVAGEDGAISGSTSITFAASGTLAGSGALAGSSSIAFTPAGTLSGTGSLTGSTTLTIGASGTLAGAGSLAGASSVAFVAISTLSGAGTLAGSSTVTLGASGTLAGAGALAGASSVTFTPSGTLHNATPIGLAGSTGIAFGASGTLTGTGALTGAAAVAFGTAGTLTGSGTLAGSSSLTFAATGTLDGVTSGAIAGSASLTFAASGELSGWGELAGVARLVFVVGGTLSGSGALAGSSSIAFAATGTLTCAGVLTGATYSRTNLRRRTSQTDVRRDRAILPDVRRDRSPTTSDGWR